MEAQPVIQDPQEDKGGGLQVLASLVTQIMSQNKIYSNVWDVA